MSTHLQRISAVEKELKRLAATSAVKEDVTKLRAEMKQVYVRPAPLPFLCRVATDAFLRGRTVCTSKSLTSVRMCGASNRTSREARAIVRTPGRGHDGTALTRCVGRLDPDLGMSDAVEDLV